MGKRERKKRQETPGTEHPKRTIEAARRSDVARPGEATPAVTGRQWAIALGVAILAQAVYMLTLFPTVAFGDSGALVTVAYDLGIAHAPGYPLYVLVGKLFSLIPVGSIAWRVNLASAVANAAAVAFVYMTVVYLTRSAWASLAAAGMYAFSPVVWKYSLLAEVFALNNLFVALTAYLAVKYIYLRRRSLVFLLALTSGLAFCHHQTIVFWLGPLWLWLLVQDRERILKSNTVLPCVLLFVGGLLPYLYLPIAAARDPIAVWGDVSSIGGVIDHVRREEYGSFNLVSGAPGTAADGLASMWLYVRHLPGQLFVLGILVAAQGLWVGIRRRAGAGFVTLTGVAFVLYVVVFHVLARVPAAPGNIFAALLEKFWMMPNLFVFIWFGYGLHVAITPKLRRPAAAAGAAALIVLVQLVVHYKSLDQSNNTLFYDNAKLKLEHLPEGALFLTAGDTDNHTIEYLKVCEHARDDVTAVSLDFLKKPWYGPIAARHYPDVTFPAEVFVPADVPRKEPYEFGGRGSSATHEGYSLSYLLDANIDRRPIYSSDFVRNVRFRAETSWKQDYDLLRMGTILRIVPKGEHPAFDAYLSESVNYLPELGDMAQLAPAVGSWEFFTWSRYWRDYIVLFSTLAQESMSEAATVPALERLAGIMVEFDKRSPFPAPESFYWDLGVVYAALSSRSGSARRELSSLWTERLKNSSPVTPEQAARVRDALGIPESR